MSWEELKTILFKCDLCEKEEIITEVRGYQSPSGWGRKHPESAFSIFGKSLDLCSDCLAKENNGLG